MTARSLRVITVGVAALTFCGPFVIATLAGLPPLGAALVGAIVLYALAIPWIAACFVPTAIVSETRVTIRAPRERVFAAIADPRHAPRLTPAVASVDEFVGEPGMVGTHWRTQLANGTVFFAEVVEAEPPTRFVLRSRSVPRWPRRPMVIEAERTLEATPAGTDVSVRQVIHTVLAARLIRWAQRSQIEHMRQWSDDQLKAALEAGWDATVATAPSG